MGCGRRSVLPTAAKGIARRYTSQPVTTPDQQDPRRCYASLLILGVAFGAAPPLEVSADLVAALSAASTAGLSPSGAVCGFGAAVNAIGREGGCDEIVPMLMIKPLGLEWQIPIGDDDLKLALRTRGPAAKKGSF